MCICFIEHYYTCTNLVKLLKALMISMSVGCLMAYQKVIRINEQVPHQSASANFRLPWIRCLRIQNNFYGSVSTCRRVRGLHIPQWHSVTHFPHCPPRRPWHHGQTGMHVHVLPPPADSLCPNQMHRNVTRRNNLCRNKSTRIAVLSCYKKNGKPRKCRINQKPMETKLTF